jgi:hypothetical protein
MLMYLTFLNLNLIQWIIKLEAPRSLSSLTWFSIWHLKLIENGGPWNRFLNRNCIPAQSLQVILIFRYYYLIQVIVASAYSIFTFWVIILKVGHPKIISTQISKQKILMWFLSHNIPISILCPTAPPSIQNGCCY